MHIQKDRVVELLRADGKHDLAHQADCALPRQVDTEADSGLLHAFDINTRDLTGSTDGRPTDGSATDGTQSEEDPGRG